MRFQVKPTLLVAIVILAVPLFVCTGFVTIGASNDQWIEWAKTAWGYFQPGLYVNRNTGLDYAAAGWPHFTDWDLGVYIKAITDAEKLGIVPRDGEWGADNRLEKVLSFLENRPRSSDKLPYHLYNADTGNADSDQTADPSDSGKLLISLDDLRRCRPEYAQRINTLVAGYNFQKLADSSYFSNNDIYPAYAAQGYKAFNYSTPNLRPVESLGNGVFLNVYNETLPQSRITSEALVLAILEDRSAGLYRTYADRIFSAQQKRFEATGKLTAFSEGVYGDPYYYLYEWIVNDKGETWVVYSVAGGKVNVVPVVYTKIAFAFHAIYNNQYTSRLVNELSSLHATAPLGGFYEGKSEEGAPDTSLTDKTNGMILAAARYYVTHTTTTFEVNVQPSSLAIVRGETGTLNVQLLPVGQFAEQVALSVTGLPSGVSYVFDQQQATPPATVVLHLTSSTYAVVGACTITVNAMSSSLSRLAFATLTVRSRTTITLQLSTQTVNISENVTITGITQPARVAPVTLLVSYGGSVWTELATVNSDRDGKFHANYSPAQHGTCMIKARAAEADFYLPSESDPVTLTVVPEFHYIAIALVISLTLVLLLVRISPASTRLERRRKDSKFSSCLSQATRQEV